MSAARAIEGKHALVTGGGSGVGKAIALALAEAGVAVTICGRREAALADVSKGSDRIFAIVADVTNEAEMTALHEKAQATRGPFDIVVANAGMAGSAPAHKTSLAGWQRTLDVNLTGAFLTVKPALAGMLARKAGRIVFVASTAGLKGYAYVAPYVAAKHGVVGLTRSAAVEYASKGIRINAVCPAHTRTAMVDGFVRFTGAPEAEALAELTRGVPMKRIGEVDEITTGILFLADPANSFMTGHALALDGGIGAI
ncbi:SDR family oxidoreductase [Mesorhizobium sp. M2A.F.Ca.ET.040.01.1.1]|nr:SDR family oxidoreductase [Mesorhizobium sp. M2A.F.Ca.ET.040.01.1.1]